MSTDPSNGHEFVRIHAVSRDESSAALRKIARACIAIARQKIADEQRQAEQPPGKPSARRPDHEENDHA